MKKTKPPVTVLPVDPEMARYDQVTLFPKKVAQAKASLARVNMAKLEELLAKPAQKPA